MSNAYDDVINAAAESFNLDPSVLKGMAYAESGFDPNVISGKRRSKTGAIGMMQFMPETAKQYDVDPTDPEQSIFAAAQYLRESLDKFDGDYGKAVASYNWGPNHKAFQTDGWEKKLPVETNRYLDKVFGYAVQNEIPRAEAPAASAAPAPAPAAPSHPDIPDTERLAADAIPTGRYHQPPQWAYEHPDAYNLAQKVREYGGPVVEALGGLGGGIAGSTAGTPAGPVGMIGGGMLGASAGYGMAKDYLHGVDVALGNVPPETAEQAKARTLEAMKEGAVLEATGQLLGRTVGPVVRLGSRSIGAVRNALSPKAATYLEAAEGRGPEIVNALRGNVEIVPGAKPTAAEAASGVGSTKFSSMGKAAEQMATTPASELRDAQKAAQLAHIRTVGQTEEALAQGKIDRQTAAQRYYKLADDTVVETDDALMELMHRPAVRSALNKAREISANKGVPLDIPSIEPAGAKPSAILSESGVPFESVIAESGSPITGKDLHTMKIALDDALSPNVTSALGKEDVKAISDARGAFIKWFENKVPAYGKARETFAKESKPVNQMEVGQYLEGKLRPALGEEAANLRAGQFATAVENAPQTIKKATGISRFDKLTDVLTEDQMKAVNAVRADLERQARTELLAKRGGGSPDIEKIATQAAKEVKAPNMLNAIVTTANSILTRVAGHMDKKLAMEIATEMLDPKLAADALEKSLAWQAKGAKMAKPFKTVGRGLQKIENVARRPGSAITAKSAYDLANKLAEPSENRNALAR